MIYDIQVSHSHYRNDNAANALNMHAMTPEVFLKTDTKGRFYLGIVFYW